MSDLLSHSSLPVSIKQDGPLRLCLYS